MIEIIPNWHPLFVHFTVSLLTTSVVFYLLAFTTKYLKAIPLTIVSEFEIVGRWCLWVGAIITIFTVAAGFYAYYTVKHDVTSHVVMTTHRNWALPTASAIFLAAIWSAWRYYKNKGLTIIFIGALLVLQGLLLITAWFGAELVFRYGIGVISLPQPEELIHHHNGVMPTSKPMMQPTDQTQRQHEHTE